MNSDGVFVLDLSVSIKLNVKCKCLLRTKHQHTLTPHRGVFGSNTRLVFLCLSLSLPLHPFSLSGFLFYYMFSYNAPLLSMSLSPYTVHYFSHILSFPVFSCVCCPLAFFFHLLSSLQPALLLSISFTQHSVIHSYLCCLPKGCLPLQQSITAHFPVRERHEQRPSAGEGERLRFCLTIPQLIETPVSLSH